MTTQSFAHSITILHMANGKYRVNHSYRTNIGLFRSTKIFRKHDLASRWAKSLRQAFKQRIVA